MKYLLSVILLAFVMACKGANDVFGYTITGNTIRECTSTMGVEYCVGTFHNQSDYVLQERHNKEEDED